MAEQFRYRPGADGGRIVGSLEQEEATILDRLFSDVIDLLDGQSVEEQDPLVALTGYSPGAAAPQDSAVLSLLPHGSSDPDASDEFRRLTDHTLRTAKSADLERSRGLLVNPSIRLTLGDAEILAKALNSVAIVLADRLEIRSEDDAQSVSEITEPKDDDEFLAVLYNFVGWMRGSLSAALIDAL